MSTKPPSLMTPPAKPAAAPAAPVKPQKWYRVDSPSVSIPRPGGQYQLNRGKVISSASYDVDRLKLMGVTLTEVSAPAWFVEAQGSPDPDSQPAA